MLINLLIGVFGGVLLMILSFLYLDESLGLVILMLSGTVVILMAMPFIAKRTFLIRIHIDDKCISQTVHKETLNCWKWSQCIDVKVIIKSNSRYISIITTDGDTIEFNYRKSRIRKIVPFVKNIELKEKLKNLKNPIFLRYTKTIK
jgi:hypothetical protein